MDRPVHPLRLRPEPGVPELRLPEYCELLKVDVPLPRHAILAEVPLLGVNARLAPQARCLLGSEHHQAALPRCGRGDKNLPSVISLQQRLFDVVDDGLEDARQRLGELVGEVPLAVDGDVVLQHVDGILGLLEIGGSLGAGDDHVRDPIPHLRRRSGVALPHPGGELDVRLFHFIVLLLSPGEAQGIFCTFVQTFGNDQAGDVHLVLQKVGDLGLDVIDRTWDIPANENLVEGRLDDFPDECTVVASDRLETFGVHVVILVRVGP
mmetsp:Transcript_52124/g.156445  ORF Transcript_52124/g.156445 Transcript_52124/m.156445 type:complete len:265 (-) Transcript_52124:2778-3572(-)